MEELSQMMINQIKQIEMLTGMHYSGGNDVEEAKKWCQEMLDYIKEQRSE